MYWLFSLFAQILLAALYFPISSKKSIWELKKKDKDKKKSLNNQDDENREIHKYMNKISETLKNSHFLKILPSIFFTFEFV